MSALGIYIHTPFCVSKCPYCDFYSMRADRATGERYVSALCRSIERYRGRGLSVSSIYFGGGTPPLLGSSGIARVLDSVRGVFDLLPEAELTLEANPADELGTFLRDIRREGINRLSLGVQSGVESELRALGRRHTVDDARRTVSLAREAGFDNISLDLMLAIPSQTEESLGRSFALIGELSPEHLSAYLLKIEPGTPYYEHTPDLPDEDSAARLYLSACEQAEGLSLEQYEISNFAKPGREGRHNLGYWLCGEYLGFGPAAHSFFESKRFYYPRDLDAFISSPSPVFDGSGGDSEEYLMLRLRLVRGVSAREYKLRFGAELEHIYFDRAQRLAQRGLARLTEDGFSLTREGFLLSNSVISYILFG